jgi:hypothetical protein
MLNRTDAIKEKQQMLLEHLAAKEPQYAVFGQPKEIVNPLIKRGLIHKDTYKFTGGCVITAKGRTLMNIKEIPTYNYTDTPLSSMQVWRADLGKLSNEDMLNDICWEQQWKPRGYNSIQFCRALNTVYLSKVAE